MKKVSAGIDIGGTNTVFGWVESNGNFLWRGKIKTADYKDPKELVKYVSQQLLEKLAENEAVGIGIGAPNGNYYNGTVEFAPNLDWPDYVPLKDYFNDHFDMPVIVTNDANATALGEMVYGSAKGVNNFIMVTLGTGLGSGIVINGQLVYGHDGFAGELGHVIVEEGGRLCGCGRRGCLETYASATAISTTAQELTSKEYTSTQVYKAANNGEQWALEAFDFTAKKLGMALANAVAITSPRCIYLFGGLAQAGDLLFKPTKQYMEENLLSIFKNKVQILPSALDGADAAILGASALVWKENS
ncbi:ROK family protein [Flavobacteriales bacterium]|nr:ROK family protein [Flavobacteriales bacterium]